MKKFLQTNFTKKQKIFLVFFPIIYCFLFLFVTTVWIFIEPGWSDIDALPTTGLRGFFSDIFALISGFLVAPMNFVEKHFARYPLLDFLCALFILYIYGVGIVMLYKLMKRKQ